MMTSFCRQRDSSYLRLNHESQNQFNMHGKVGIGLGEGPLRPLCLAASSPDEHSYSRVKRSEAIQVMEQREEKRAETFPSSTTPPSITPGTVPRRFAPDGRGDAWGIGPTQLNPLVSAAPLTRTHPSGLSASPIKTSCQNHPRSFAE